jgi:hypothetical protein
MARWLVKVYLLRSRAEHISESRFFAGRLRTEPLEVGRGLTLQRGRLSSRRAISTA